MRIGIIGAGNMGATLAAQLTRLGHQVAIANSRGPQTLAGVAAQTGAAPGPVTEVTSKADVVIVAIPEKSIPKLPAGLLSALPEDTVVIDTGNYVPELRDGHIDAIDAGLPESQWVQSQLRHPVVKAFNTIRPASLASLGKSAGAAGRTVIPVAADDPAAKSAVLELADQLGFDGLDAGPLAESWRQQPGTPIYTTDLPLDAARRALADATPEQTARWRSQHPQHRKPTTAIHPSRRTGVRFVLTNPSDPSRLDEFSDWYDSYSAGLTVPGYLANDVHFENPDASGEKASPRYATIYDIVAPDPATAWPDTEHSPAYPTHLFTDPRATLVSPALRASYALVGSQLQPAQHGPLTGIHVILSNGGGDTERQHQEAQILQTGLFYSAARFRLIEGSPEPAGWLEIFETDDPDPLHAYPRATSHTSPASQIQPQLSESFRLAGARNTNGALAEYASADLPVMRDHHHGNPRPTTAQIGGSARGYLAYLSCHRRFTIMGVHRKARAVNAYLSRPRATDNTRYAAGRGFEQAPSVRGRPDKTDGPRRPPREGWLLHNEDVSREGEPRQGLVRGDPSASRVIYGGQLRTVPPRYDPVARWYERVDTWLGKLQEILKKATDEPPAEKPEAELHVLALIVGLMWKLGRLVVLTGWVCLYVLWQRITRIGGHH